MEEENKFEIINQYKQRFIRWQQLTQTQLSFTNNLILTITIGFIAFSVSVTGFKFPDKCPIFFLSIFGYISLLISLLTGLLLTVNRLYDFRKTKDLIKYKQKRFENGKDKTIEFKISQLKFRIDLLGKRTWCLLHWQLWSFLIGLILILTSIIIIKNY